MQGVDHRLFGYIDGAQSCSAVRWAQDARQEIWNAHAAGARSILVGGTGLYIRTLLDGIAPIPDIAPDIRHKVRALTVSEAYSDLKECDPGAANRLAATDRNRVMRALEVALSTGRTIADWQSRKEGGIAASVKLTPVILLPDREKLYQRCDLRFESMFESGAVDEVKRLLQRKLPADRPVMRAIGVPEIAAVLSGSLDQAHAIEHAKKATRHYAKRQYTWFRNQLPGNWPRLNEFDSIDIGEYFEI